VAVTVNVAEFPAWIEVGLAVIVTVGFGELPPVKMEQPVPAMVMKPKEMNSRIWQMRRGVGALGKVLSFRAPQPNAL
jgi:hypothetical protein